MGMLCVSFRGGFTQLVETAEDMVGTICVSFGGNDEAVGLLCASFGGSEFAWLVAAEDAVECRGALSRFRAPFTSQVRNEGQNGSVDLLRRLRGVDILLTILTMEECARPAATLLATSIRSSSDSSWNAAIVAF